MHELAVCQALIEQVETLAEQHRAVSVSAIIVCVGPLSGIERPLLEQAYEIARAGTIAETADLLFEEVPLVVHCPDCDRQSAVAASRLVCPLCGNWRTTLVSGDELLLARLELETAALLH
jgi:hydrogenase nickel incorporation protein HypA/HybF